MNASYAIEGNLALAQPAVQPASDPKPHFVVVSGGKTQPASLRVHQGGFVQHARIRHVLMFGIVFAVLAATCVTLALRFESHAAAIANASFERIEVHSGDSLWGIAEDHGIDGLTTADVVEAIRQQNDLSSGSLNPGQMLSVPAVAR